MSQWLPAKGRTERTNGEENHISRDILIDIFLRPVFRSQHFYETNEGGCYKMRRKGE